MGAGTQEKGRRKVLGKWKKPERAESAKVAGRGRKRKTLHNAIFYSRKKGVGAAIKGYGKRAV